MDMTATKLEFDEEVQKLYKRHDGGEDTPKGVLKASLYPDYSEIQEKEAAALLVTLDIYRGIPAEDGFIFGGDRKLAKSAFIRMLMAACGGYKKDIFAVERIEEGITVAEAKAMAAEKLGGQGTQVLQRFDSHEPLTREIAVQLLAAAIHASDGTGEIPYLYYVDREQSMDYLRLPEKVFVAGPDGYLVTLTVDGVFQPITGGWDYSGDVRLSLSPRYELYRYLAPRGKFFGGGEDTRPIGPNWWNDWGEPYRTALYIEDGKKVPERSIDAAWHQDEQGILLRSDGSPTNRYGSNDFNGIIVNGKIPGSRYEIDRLKVRFDGNSRDDFQGMGAALLMVGDATETTVDHADIKNHGTVRSAMVVGGSARVLVKNSRLQTTDGAFEKEFRTGYDTVTGDMRMAPKQGGFEGNCRCTNLLDKGVVTYYNSQILAEKWGVLSTDNNEGAYSAVVNSFVGINGGLNPKVDTSSEQAARETLASIPFRHIYGDLKREISNDGHSFRHPAGYGTYSIGNTTVKFAGSTVSSVDFSAVCANDAASVIYCASTPENLQGEFGLEGLPVEEKNTVVYCNKTGLQLHRGNGKGLALVKDHTLFHCGAMCVAIKSSGAENFHADNATLISEMGVILQMMDEDDVNAPIYTAPESPSAEDRAAAWKLIRDGALDIFHVRKEWDSTAKFSNMTVNGDTYNSCGYTGPVTLEDIEAAAKAENPFPGPARMGGSRFHSENARNLGITLENCIYNGAISTAEAYHFDEETGEVMTQVPREKWYCLMVVKSEVKPVYQAGIILNMQRGSVWNVPKTCFISSLTMDESSEIHGRVFVDDVLVQPVPGVTYTGMIRVEPGT